MFAMAFYYGVTLGADILMLIPLALPFVLQIWIYLTPINLSGQLHFGRLALADGAESAERK